MCVVRVHTHNTRTAIMVVSGTGTVVVQVQVHSEYRCVHVRYTPNTIHRIFITREYDGSLEST